MSPRSEDFLNQARERLKVARGDYDAESTDGETAERLLAEAERFIDTIAEALESLAERQHVLALTQAGSRYSLVAERSACSSVQTKAHSSKIP